MFKLVCVPALERDNFCFPCVFLPSYGRGIGAWKPGAKVYQHVHECSACSPCRSLTHLTEPLAPVDLIMQLAVGGLGCGICRLWTAARPWMILIVMGLRQEAPMCPVFWSGPGTFLAGIHWQFGTHLAGDLWVGRKGWVSSLEKPTGHNVLFGIITGSTFKTSSWQNRGCWKAGHWAPGFLFLSSQCFSLSAAFWKHTMYWNPAFWRHLDASHLYFKENWGPCMLCSQ